MRIPRFLFRVFVALGLIGWGQFVFAEDYYWWASGLSGQQFSSAADACDAKGNQLYPANPKYVSSAVSISQDGSSATCTPTVQSGTSDPFVTSIYSVFRSGASCPSGTTYNYSTGSCDSDTPCEPTIGNIISHQHNTGNVVGAPLEDPPDSVCEGSCQYANTWNNQKCYRFAESDKPDDLFCRFDYVGNGLSCTASDVSNPSVFDQPPTVPPIDLTPSLDSDSSCGSWVTNPDGTLSRSCTSTNNYKNPGDVDCSNFATTGGCTGSHNPPAKSDTTTVSDTVKSANPDGSTDTTTTTTTDKTNCYGLKPCSTDSTTKTDKSNTGADGTPGPSSSSCKGDGCTGSGDGSDPSKDPDEDKEVERTAVVGSCDAAVQCTGDPIDCAVLQKQKEQLCHAQEQADYEAKSSDIEGMFQGDQFELDSSEISAPSFINSGTRFLPSSCPPPESISLSSNGGHTFQLKYDPICRVASDFSFLIVAFASLFAALYVGRAFGGE